MKIQLPAFRKQAYGFPDQGCKIFPAFPPVERPNLFQGFDGVIAIRRFPCAIPSAFRMGAFELDSSACDYGQFHHIKMPQQFDRVFPLPVPGRGEKLIQDLGLLFLLFCPPIPRCIFLRQLQSCTHGYPHFDLRPLLSDGIVCYFWVSFLK
ncbi:hypothetical protein TREPR_3891 [Treponema primitia ZAS-2]|uniref:Uncharacterized protein n=1 Tax=Treponema primitia (strain ATCC BAA-887 / DSM 12427 / ZAS-2) TaxID=545694 RepID=F5YP07_TREPZ|nr:hypothetical protein TREPR_3891 [Treponema primitia ZAS-2]